MEISRYDIELDLSKDQDEYPGIETIMVKSWSGDFFLHAVNMDILTVEINSEKSKFDYDKHSGVIKFKDQVRDGSEIRITFNGHISDSLMGLYKCRTNNGYALSTQFESVGARMMFPCRDEPEYKAIFHLKIRIPEEFSAISNMPPMNSGKEGNVKVVEFEDTPRMSTYLVYVGVGKYSEVTDSSQKPDIIMAYPGSSIPSTNFPLEVARKSISYYEDYYGIRYALPKMHLLGIPEFGSGAMENWGAITFRETALFVNKNSSQSTRKWVSDTIAHEIAHQWFGDLVTMKWWNDLWLNESFATFMSYKAVNTIYPEFDMWGDFVSSETAMAMAGDSLESTHPINVEVKDPEEIAQIFDEISYGKGGSVLRMIESYVGIENFRKGISLYLKQHSYKNAKNEDLWNSIEKASGMPVTAVMSQWINRPGYPFISTERSNGMIRLTQQRFLLNGKSSDETWPLPVLIRRRSGVDSLLMNERSVDIQGDDIVSLNYDSIGFYRVLYDEKTLEEILKNLDKMNNLEKRGFLSDTFAMLQSGKIPFDKYLSTVSRLTEEKNYLILKEIASQLYNMYSIDPTSKPLLDFSRKFYSTALKNLGSKSKDEDINISILRGDLREKLSVIDQGFAKNLASDFRNFFSIDGELRRSVAIAYAVDTNDFEELYSRYKDAKTDEDKLYLLSGLTWLKGRANFERITEMLQEGEIKMQDSLRIYAGFIYNPAAREFMISIFKSAVETLRKVFEGTGYASRIIEGALPILGIDQREKMLSLIESVKGPDIKSGINKGMEYLEINLRLKNAIDAYAMNVY
jgi:tricorn protease interacting factor F2/3